MEGLQILFWPESISWMQQKLQPNQESFLFEVTVELTYHFRNLIEGRD